MTHPLAMMEAERWVLLANEGLSSADEAAFERWRRAPAHAEAFVRAQRQWQSFGGLAGREEIERLADRAFADTAPERRIRRQGVVRGLAASFVVAILTTSAFVTGRHYTPTHTYETEAGQQSTVQLDDGSQLILNSATRLEMKFTESSRRFTLRKGEAVFTVAEDPLRPFTVAAGDGEVTALGTRFQVRHDAQRVTVTLLEGRVAVDRADEKQHLQLTPGDRVRYASSARDMKRDVVDPEVASSWTTGRLKFKATPLAEVLEEVNRYTKTHIRLQDTSLAGTPIYGVFDLGDVTSVVQGLQSMLPLEVWKQDRREIVLVRK